jgi:hypothetical protein
LKANHSAGFTARLEEVAEKVGFSLAAPKGALDNAALTVCLKAYPDTNLEFFRNLWNSRPSRTGSNRSLSAASEVVPFPICIFVGFS